MSNNSKKDKKDNKPDSKEIRKNHTKLLFIEIIGTIALSVIVVGVVLSNSSNIPTDNKINTQTSTNTNAQINTQTDGQVDNSIVTQIKNSKGYIYKISAEEFDFYQTLVLKSKPNTTGAELYNLTADYARTVNAKFFIANKLGLCNSYDFATLQYDMENENADRKLKRQTGEVYYGVDEFDIYSYFQYVYSDLESDIEEYLRKNADDNIIKGAKEYFENNQDKFVYTSSITYKTIVDGQEEVQTVDYDGINNLQKIDSPLFDFVSSANVGDKAVDSSNPSRSFELLDVQTTTMNYNDNSYTIIQAYVSDVLVEELVQTVIINNPIEFDF